MHTSRLTFEDLPDCLPVFPLSDVLLLPHGQLPLNIFEPRYIAMVDDVLAGHRMIGMVQPRGDRPCGIYRTGCAGRIVNFAESEGGRYLVTLTGVCRFDIRAETPAQTPYRSVVPDWSRYRADMAPQEKTVTVDRARLNRLLKAYFTQQEMSCDWDKMDIAADTELLTALAMICPLKASEKQALLESVDLRTRTELFMTMIEMATCNACTDADGGCCH